MRKLLIATQNQGKLQEIYSLLEDVKIELVSPDDLNLDLEIVEDGKTYSENAAKKAKGYSQASNYLTLADDTGLEVNALNGQPGLYSARYSLKPNAKDYDRRMQLLQQLKHHPQPWKARFTCAVALVDPEGRNIMSEGHCQGIIIPEERGEFGFGYDQIFQVQDTGKTMAELGMHEKNLISHRARAVSAIKPQLLEIIQE